MTVDRGRCCSGSVHNVITLMHAYAPIDLLMDTFETLRGGGFVIFARARMAEPRFGPCCRRKSRNLSLPRRHHFQPVALPRFR